jgi:heat shock protein HtpX
LTHIINRDVRTMIIAAVFAGIISLVAQVLARLLWFRGGDRDDRRGGGALVLVGVAAAAIAWFLAIVVRMAISRRREFVADAGSVELTKNPDAMITALQKVAGHAHLDAPEEVRGLFLENVEEGVFGLFATHPPIEARIEALERYAGGRVSEPPAPPSAPAPFSTPAPSMPPSSAPGPWDEPPAKGPWG